MCQAHRCQVSHTHSHLEENKQAVSEWPQKLSCCAFENKNVSVMPEVGRYWWRKAEGALRKVMVEWSHTEKEVAAQAAMESPAVMQRWELWYVWKAQKQQFDFCICCTKIVFGNLLHSGLWDLEKNQSGSLWSCDWALSGEREPRSQHKMSHLLHQETKFCLKKSNQNQTQHHLQTPQFPKVQKYFPSLKTLEYLWQTTQHLSSYISIMWMKHFGSALI